MISKRIKIDDLIEIIRQGGRVKTGVDVYNDQGVLLLERDVVIKTVKTLELLQEKGINALPLDGGSQSGIWDAQGNQVSISKDGAIGIETKGDKKTAPVGALGAIEKRLREIEALKSIAAEKYDHAKENIKQVLGQIRETGGEFDYDEVESHVSELVEFLTVTENPFSYLTKEIFTYDDYLYNHSVNVCAIGTAVVNRFNTNFSAVINDHLNAGAPGTYDPFVKKADNEKDSYKCYHMDEIREISMGFFLHDIGKVMVPDEVLNKSGKLTPKEFNLVKRHSHDFGAEILETNRLKNAFIRNIVKYHHAPLYAGEKRGYPEDRHPGDLPIYVKIAKLADIYDAMTSKRCYKEAFNQISVVTDIFRQYAKKDTMLQYVLHAFVKSIGIYPPGSIVFLRNGQMAYVLESAGPLVIPFTDTGGKTLQEKPDPMDMGDKKMKDGLRIDNRRSVKTPLEVHNLLPAYLKPKTT
ncbi:MAG: HD domain-containing protein [Desulfobacteraceae bacterium]|nr:HD domain-containing protein [Desulfobacteraceae bacterium]